LSELQVTARLPGHQLGREIGDPPVHQHERRLEQRVVGIETAEHPADAQMIAVARSYFGAADHLPIT